MKHRVRNSCIRKLDCYHFSWRRSHYWVLCRLFFSFYWRERLMNRMFFVWTLLMININFCINPCHLRGSIVSWKITIHFPSIVITPFSRLCNFWEIIILWKAILNSTFSIFKCNCNPIVIVGVIVQLFLFFVWIILWLKFYVGRSSNIRTLILLLLYLNRFLFNNFFRLLVLLSHDYTRSNTPPSLFILWLFSLLRACVLWMCDIDRLHRALAVLAVMYSFPDSWRSWLRIVFIFIHYTSLTFINTTYVCMMWTSN